MSSKLAIRRDPTNGHSPLPVRIEPEQMQGATPHLTRADCRMTTDAYAQFEQRMEGEQGAASFDRLVGRPR
jgi:hypothetical protein